MTNLDFKQIGQRLREIRMSRGLTQEYVANAVNINTSHISNIENNRVKVSLTALVAICNVLNTTVDYVISGEYSAASASAVLDEAILRALKDCPDEKKERILKIIPFI